MKKSGMGILVGISLAGLLHAARADDEPAPGYNYFPGQQVAFGPSSGPVVAGYITANRMNDGYNLNQIPANNLTHLLYAFLSVCDSANPYKGINAGVTATESFCAGANLSNYQLAVNASSADNAHYTALANYKLAAPNVKLLFSIGGGSPATVPFYNLSKTAATRAVFINSVVAYLAAHPAYDGVDIDWESPTSFQGDTSALGANPPVIGTPADSQAYVDLLAELRSALDGLGAGTGQTYLLTTAVSSDANLVKNINYVAAQASLDYVFAMTYDYYGYSASVGNHTALYNANPLYGISNLLNAGVPANKLVLGAAMYSQGWTGATLASSAPARGSGTLTGANTYAALAANSIDANGNGKNGYTVNYDTTEQAYYLWNPTGNVFISYDDPRAVAVKGQYAVSQGLAGIFAWELGQDNGDLLGAMNYGVGNPKQ
jgi:chitinase